VTCNISRHSAKLILPVVQRYCLGPHLQCPLLTG
jgi:hypothetical protein